MRGAALRTALAVALVLGASLAAAQAPKYGGVLRAMHRPDQEGFSIHESPTPSTTWPAAPCFSNLVMFDPFKPHESVDTIVPELAERWAWQDGGRSLVFHLREAVRWHDGQPFTARDVKYTFDMVRGAPEAMARLRVSPRRDWYANVDAIDTPDATTVVFRLKRPQPSLLMMLASGLSPIYPAHVAPAEFRTRCLGTGPFKLKQYVPGQLVEYERNRDYFLKRRPYLDGIRYVIGTERGTRVAALQTGQLDVAYPSEITRTIAENLKAAVPSMVITEVSQSGSDNVIMNFKRPPFDHPAVRRAIDLALDRAAYVKVARGGGAIIGGLLAPPPYGAWGMSERELRPLPGYGDGAAGKAEARRLLAAAGFGPGKPLAVEMITRTLPSYLDFASYVAGELRQVGVNATIVQVETASWFQRTARREYAIGANLSTIPVDDPDVILYESYKCGATRNYPDYCNPEVDRLIDAQSQELDRARRRELVREIERRLVGDEARPMLGWRKDYYAHWPYVKNLVPHHSLHNYYRMQEVWLDR